MITQRFFPMVLLFFAAGFHELRADEETISSTKVNFDHKQTESLETSIRNYLNRFLTKSASDENRQTAENFLKSLYSVSSPECKYLKTTEGTELICSVKSKQIIRSINIQNLPSSLLESELRRKLPIQVGHTVDLDANFDEVLVVVKARTETFLRKNGFYGATVNVSRNLEKEGNFVDVIVTIADGVFARINDVTVFGDSPISPRVVRRMFMRMCFSFNRIMESITMGTLNCYTRELERETIHSLQERFAKMGYVQSQIRVSQHWIDPNDTLAPRGCRKKSQNDEVARCLNLRVDIDKGPKVRWGINVKDRLAINRNAFLRFIATMFSVDQFSRATIPPNSDEVPLDYVIVEEELLKKVSFVAAKNVDEQELEESAQEITNYLVAQGYPHAEVIPSLVQEDQNNISVNFDVYAGRPNFINSVQIMPPEYRKFINSEYLESLVPIRSMTENGSISYSKIESAENEMKDILVSKGFSNIKVKADLESEDNGQVNITFNIVTSERETLDEIIIENGYGDLNESLVPFLKNCDNYRHHRRHKQKNKLCHGSSFVRDGIEADSNRITDVYRDNAFLYAAVKSEVVEGDSKKIIFTIYDTRLGPDSKTPLKRQDIKDIIVSGNSSTRTSVIKRLFPKARRTGILDPTALKKGLASLRESGRFSRIDHKILAGEDKSDDVYFLLQVAERPSLSIDTSIAFSTDQFFNAEVELEETNLFSSMLRLNTSLGMGLLIGRQTFFNNKLVWPFMFGKPLRLTINAPYIVYDDLTHRPNPSRRVQSKVSFGLDWRVSARITPYLKYWLVLTQEDKFTPGTIPRPTFGERLSTLDGLIPTLKLKGKVRGVLKPGISFIELDNPFDPRLGIDANLWTEFSGGPFSGSPPFVNIGIQNRFFFPIGPITIALQATFMRAFIEPNEANWKELTNHSTMDSLGGDRSIRGYAEGKIGIANGLKTPIGPYGGYFSNIANIEIRFPITTKSSIGNFSGALFVDQGMLIPCSSLFNCMDGKSIKSIIAQDGFGLSVGAAVRYSLPVGPISLDYGISPLTGKGRVHLLFGYAF